MTRTAGSSTADRKVKQATAEAWLTRQPQIEIVARDRGGGYAQAIARALPHADQVADRWHLMENASHAFLDAVRKSMRQVRTAIGTATVNPKLLIAAERLQYEGYLRREEASAVIRGSSARVCPSRTLCAEPDLAESWSAVSFVVSGLTSSGFGKPLSDRDCLGLKRNGMLDCVMAPNCGGSFGWLV